MFRSLVLISLLALTFTSCRTPSLNSQQAVLFQNQNTTKFSSYYPMKPGLTWAYDLKQSQNGQNNTRFKTMTVQTHSVPENVSESDDTRLLNQTVFERSYPDSDVQPRPTLARLFEDRLLLSHYAPTTETEQILPFSGLTVRSTGFITALQSPLTKGNSWPGRTFKGGTETILVSDTEILQLPAGTFKTLRVEHHIQYDNGRKDTLKYWYAPDVGLVKMYEEVSLFLKEWIRLESTAVLTAFKAP